MIGGAALGSRENPNPYASKSRGPVGQDQITLAHGFFPTAFDTPGTGGGLSAGKAVRLEKFTAPRPSRAVNTEAAPLRVALKIQERWGITDAEMARICGVNLTDGESLPSVLFAAMAMPDVAARLRALFNIKLRLSALYTTLEAERGWLRTASRVLRDRVRWNC